MKLRNSLLAIALVVVAALVIRFVASTHDDDCLGPRPCDVPGGATADSPRSDPETTQAAVPDISEAPSGRIPLDSARLETASADHQQPVVEESSLSLVGILPTIDDACFDNLVADLRSQQSQIGSERRAHFESLIFSHPSSVDGSVYLDVMECGSVLCAADFRSDDGEALDELIREVTESEAFGVSLLIGFEGSEIYSYGETRRLVFPHDPALTELLIPDEGFWDSFSECGAD